MASLIWNYNPISLTYNTLSNISYYLSNEELKIVKPKTLSEYDILLINNNNVLFDEELKPICNSINSFNILNKTDKKISILSIDNNMTNRKLKKLLNENNYDYDSNIKYLSNGNLSLVKIENILIDYCNKNSDSINLIRKFKYQKKKNLNKNIKFLKVGIIGTTYYFDFIKKNMENKYTNVIYYHIYDDVINDLDLLIIGKLDDYDNIVKNILIEKENGKNNDILMCKNILYTYEKNVNVENNTSVIFNNLLTKNNINLKTDKEYKLDSKYYEDKLFLYFKSNIKILNITNDFIFDDSNIDEKLNIKVDNCLCINNDIEIINKIKDNSLKNKINYVIPDISYLTTLNN